MARDLFEEYGIAPKKKKKPVDLFEQQDIDIPQETKGFKGVASDALSKSIETLMGLPSAVMNLPGEAYGAGKQALTDHTRALQNVGAGFGELGHGILSAPGNVRDYLAKKDIISQNAPSMRLPESMLPKDFDYAQAAGIRGQQPGDALLRGIPASIAMAPLGGAMSEATEAMAPMLAKIPRMANLKELGAKRSAAQAAYEQEQALLESLRKKQAEEHAGASEEKNMHLREIEQHLGKGKTLDVALADEINNSLKQAKVHIQKNYYEPVEKYTKDNYVQLPRTINMDEIERQLHRLTKDPEFAKSPGFERMKEALIKDRPTKRDLVPAHDFVKQWKETKQAASKARRKGFMEGGENQSYWQDQAANLKELADKQLQVLKEQLPEEHFNKLRMADQLWKEEITPFYGNKIREQAKKYGRIDVPNIMNEVRGKGMGQEKMKELLLANPKLTRLALGHTYAKAPEKLLSLPLHEQEFVNKLPELQKMLDRLRLHNQNVNISKANIDLFKTNYPKTSTQENFENLEKQYQEAIKNKKKHLSKVKKFAAYGLGAAGVDEAIKKILGK
jgi:hypothetical protein